MKSNYELFHNEQFPLQSIKLQMIFEIKFYRKE